MKGAPKLTLTRSSLRKNVTDSVFQRVCLPPHAQSYFRHRTFVLIVSCSQHRSLFCARRLNQSFIIKILYTLYSRSLEASSTPTISKQVPTRPPNPCLCPYEWQLRLNLPLPSHPDSTLASVQDQNPLIVERVIAQRRIGISPIQVRMNNRALNHPIRDATVGRRYLGSA